MQTASFLLRTHGVSSVTSPLRGKCQCVRKCHESAWRFTRERTKKAKAEMRGAQGNDTSFGGESWQKSADRSLLIGSTGIAGRTSEEGVTSASISGHSILSSLQTGSNTGRHARNG